MKDHHKHPGVYLRLHGKGRAVHGPDPPHEYGDDGDEHPEVSGAAGGPHVAVRRGLVLVLGLLSLQLQQLHHHLEGVGSG